jgi:glucokinase
MLATRYSPEPPAAPSGLLAEVTDMVQACLAQAGLRQENLVRIGCGFGAPVDAASGVVLPSRRFPDWDNIPLASLIEEQLGAPCLVDNNARVAALGETRSGAARGERHVIYIQLGTGLGGGIIVDGRLYHGATTTAGEIGHLVMAEEGPICSCGRPGHLEAYASGQAIVQRALALAQQQAPDGPLLGAAGNGQPTPARVFEAAQQGDPAARAITGEAVHMLGIALANLISAFNPGVVVVGGSVAEAGALLFDPLGSVVRRYVMAGPARATRIVPARLRDEAVISGAIALALQSLDWT